MTEREAILRAVPIFPENPPGDLYQLRDQLVSGGLPGGIATDIIEFLPLAFSRSVLNGMGIGFKDYYIRVLPNGEQLPPKKLLDEPIFRAGLAVAGEVRAMGRDTFMAVLLCSSEFQAVNDALNAGSKPENLDHAPQIILTREDDPRSFSSSSKPIGKSTRAWWQFWK